MNWNWTYTFDVVLPALIKVAPVTLIATFASFALALVLGLALVVARLSAIGPVAVITREAIEFVRGTPIVVQLYVLFFVLPDIGIVLPPLLTGIIVLGIHNAAYLAEVFRAGLASVPQGQWEAALALNLSRAGTLRRIIIPQAIPPILPDIGNYLVAIFKETPLLAFIAVVEILHEAKIIGNESFRFMEPITVAGIFFIVFSLAAAGGIAALERYVRRRIFLT